MPRRARAATRSRSPFSSANGDLESVRHQVSEVGYQYTARVSSCALLMPDTRSLIPVAEARPAVRSLEGSRIREIANAGMGDPDVLAFWFGEPDQVTPAFIRDAATASLARGETFYSQNFGIAELRRAIAGYVGALHRPTTPDEIAVTASGMSALMLAVEALVAPGDRVVVVTPLW